ncbi:MAG: WG repeat-containing protein [Cyclobacteriaceae bacterium]|nr:WG repeat-containing protein [Cyclobacteriaceae bacterium]
MKIILFTYITFLIVLSTQAQNNNTWTAFWDESSGLTGFKNAKGQIEIEPKFMGLTTAKKFDGIIAAMEEKEGNYETYYLTKSGKKVGFDSLYMYDNGADCESEGYIRFRDKETDKVGMFDKNGTIIIPAIYNELSRVHNGLVWALKEAKKEYWDKHKEDGCNHYSWKDGKEMLINTKNEIIIENIEYESNLSLLSLQISAEQNDTLNRQSFKGKNGKFYSFIDFEKEFSNWMNSELPNSLTLDKLIKVSFDSITYFKEPNGWKTELKADFLKRNVELIKTRLLEIKKPETDYFISINGLNPFIFEGKEFSKYYNNCGEAMSAKYPVMSLIINNKTKSGLLQDHFDFIRTDDGYKLISITISNGEVK